MKPLATLLLFSLLAAAAGAQRLPSTTGDTTPAKYVIELTDRLRVSVYQEDDLSIIARVDSEGCINLPLVDRVKVRGLALEEAQRAVEDAYVKARILRKPKVTINVEEYAPREVSIHGAVRTPGRYPLPIEATLSVHDLVTKAGGLRDTAKGNDVTVTRVAPDGKKTVFHVDVDSLIKGKSPSVPDRQDRPLEPGDIVNVGERII